MLRRLIDEQFEEVRYHLQGRKVWTEEQIEAMVGHPDRRVRLAVSMRPELTEEERAAIDYHVGRDDRIGRVHWIWGIADPAELAWVVRSAHVGLRRSVAMRSDPPVPPDAAVYLGNWPAGKLPPGVS